MLSCGENKGRRIISPRTQLLAVLWLLATPDSYQSGGQKFDLGKSSLRDSFRRIIKAINNLADSLIVWPKRNEINAVKYQFSQLGPSPDVIGAIDGTYISIKAPKDNPSFYKTRKKEFAITYKLFVMQILCLEIVLRDLEDLFMTEEYVLGLIYGQKYIITKKHFFLIMNI